MFRTSLAEKSEDVTGEEGARAIGKKPTQGQNLNKLKTEGSGPNGNRGVCLLRFVCIKECLVLRSVLLL